MSEKVFHKVINLIEGDHVRRSQYKLSQGMLLNGYKRCKVRNELYPAAIKWEGDSIQGALVYGLTEEDITFLDEFEGDEYARVPVIVNDSHGNCIDAEFYEWIAGESSLMVDERWELEESKIDEFFSAL